MFESAFLNVLMQIFLYTALVLAAVGFIMAGVGSFMDGRIASGIGNMLFGLPMAAILLWIVIT
ncbi:MAG: hypothetical protein FWE40_03850 [Oscillospiraceae bacterium]|nr:hypothetical protein [Oscillospiraceae bacterium]